MPPAPNVRKGTEITAAERVVLKYVAQGLRDKDIAFEIGIDISTVKAHYFNLKHRLDLCTATRVYMAGLYWNNMSVVNAKLCLARFQPGKQACWPQDLRVEIKLEQV